MQTTRSLIDRARELVHSDAELARAIGESPQNLAGIKAGRRKLSDAHVAALCDLLHLPGEEAQLWLAIAATEREPDPDKQSLLRRAFFACWVLGVVALMLPTNDAHGMGWTAATDRVSQGSERAVYTLARI